MTARGVGRVSRAARVRAQLALEFLRIRRLKFAVAAVVAAAVLLGLPALYLVERASDGPAGAALDELNPPAWSGPVGADAVEGNRWCLGRCRVVERSWTSGRDLDETSSEWRSQLGDLGWTAAASCPQPERGRAWCLRRQELTMRLWTRTVECDGADCGGVLVSLAAGPRVDSESAGARTSSRTAGRAATAGGAR